FLPADALIYGTNPLLLLDELRAIGPTTISPIVDRIPSLDLIDPETPYIGWQVDIEAEDPTAAIDDVFLFLRDNMELSLERLAAAAGATAEPSLPAPADLPSLAPVEAAPS